MACVQLTQACRWVSRLSRLCLFILCFPVWFTCPVLAARLAWRFGDVFWFCFRFSLLFSPCLFPVVHLVFGGALVFSSSSRPLSFWAGRLPLFLSVVCVCLAPRVSRQSVTLTCSDHVQFIPPVDLCVLELSPPLSILSRGLWQAWCEFAPLLATPVELLVRAVFWFDWRVGVRVGVGVLVSLSLSLFLVDRLLSFIGARSLSELFLVNCHFMWVCSCSLAQW